MKGGEGGDSATKASGHFLSSPMQGRVDGQKEQERQGRRIRILCFLAGQKESRPCIFPPPLKPG